MADLKLSELTVLAGADAVSGDIIPILDIADTTMSGAGTDKGITLGELAIGVATVTGAGIFTGQYHDGGTITTVPTAVPTALGWAELSNGVEVLQAFTAGDSPVASLYNGLYIVNATVVRTSGAGGYELSVSINAAAALGVTGATTDRAQCSCAAGPGASIEIFIEQSSGSDMEFYTSVNIAALVLS